jgi:hypothetical protein
VDTKNYFVIQKKIKDIWEDWVEFNESVSLDEVLSVFNTKDKTQHQLVKRTDKTIKVS